MAWSLSFYIFISYLISFRLNKYYLFLPSLALYCPHSKREIKLGLKALKDLGDISYK